MVQVLTYATAALEEVSSQGFSVFWGGSHITQNGATNSAAIPLCSDRPVKAAVNVEGLTGIVRP